MDKRLARIGFCFSVWKQGTPDFTKKWKDLAASNPDGLRKNEHEFIKETHYDPQVRKLKKELGLDVDKRSAVLRDVVWSTAVQHGPNSGIIIQAAKPLLAGGKNFADLSDEALIRAIYAERGRKTPDGKLVHFPGVSPDWIPALSKRFDAELKDALKMLSP